MKLLWQSSPCRAVKAPGPNGFPIEFYKAFSSKLSPRLSSIYNEILSSQKLPQTFNQETHSVFLKKDKNPLDCGSYCPISLLCCDYKILTKVLSCRLKTVMLNIINSDQTRFFSGRQYFYHTRRIFKVLHSAHSTRQPEVVISLDAEKAFDRVEWEHLFTVLERFGFGPSFLSWIKILYSSPVASVRTKNVTSSYFPLPQGYELIDLK
jgi:hypothetical protein